MSNEKPKDIILVKRYFNANVKEMRELTKEDRDELGALCSAHYDVCPEDFEKPPKEQV
jgi:hypothetical protein